MDAVAEMRQRSCHLLAAKEIVTRVEHMIQVWDSRKQAVERLHVVRGRAGIVVVLHHHVEPLSLCLRHEGAGSRINPFRQLRRRLVGQQSQHQQQARVMVAVHEVEGSPALLRLITLHKVHIDNSAGVTEAEAVERAQLLLAQRDTHVDAAISQLLHPLCRLSEREALLTSNVLHMIAEDGDVSLRIRRSQHEGKRHQNR